MVHNINIELRDGLYNYVEERSGSDNMYPDEFVKDLIGKDYARHVIGEVSQGLQEVVEGKSINITATQIFNEE